MSEIEQLFEELTEEDKDKDFVNEDRTQFLKTNTRNYAKTISKIPIIDEDKIDEIVRKVVKLFDLENK